jgi:uncharacterized protein YkwD
VFRGHRIIFISFYIVILTILVVSCATLTPEVTEAVTTDVIALTPTEETIVPEPTPEMTLTPLPRATPIPGATSSIPPTTPPPGVGARPATLEPGVGARPAATLESPVLPVTPSADLASLELAMVKAINEERQKRGLPPYRVDQQLTMAARAHAQDMVARGYFDHVTPEGKTLRDRLRERGLEPYWAGENWLRAVRPTDEVVQYAIEWFMADPPHRDNILHTHYDRVGVGVAEGPSGWTTFVLDFAGGVK